MKIDHVSAAYLLGLPSLPGICPEETDLIRDFVARCGHAYSSFSVNVPVGPGDTSTPSLGAAIDRMWEAITRPRIDLIVHGFRSTFIVEAKEHARFRAVTQVRKYVERYNATVHRDRHATPVVLCRSHERGLIELMLLHQGLLVVEPCPFERAVAAR